MIRGVVFDMDGVLVDAREWHYDALNRAIGLFGYTIARAEHIQTFDGLPTSRKLQILSQEQNLPFGLHNFINEMKQLYTLEHIHTKCKPTFAHQYALAQLRARGFKVGVASNSIRESVDLMMRKTALYEYLDVILGASDVPRPKPYPDIYLEASVKLGIPPAELLVVEDNKNGVAAAVAAGCKVLEVVNPQEVYFEKIIGHIEELNEDDL